MELLRERGRVGEEQGTQKWFHSGRNKVIKYEQKYGFYGKRSDAESMNLALVWSSGTLAHANLLAKYTQLSLCHA